MIDREKQIFDKYGNYDFPTDIKQKEHNTATTQIEQMENDICNACKPRVAKCKCNFPCIMCGIVATELVKKYQPKIPEDSVVLTKEEIKHPTRTEVIEFFVNHNAEVRKETAREILKEFEYCNDTTFYSKWLELAKQYGVDLKE